MTPTSSNPPGSFDPPEPADDDPLAPLDPANEEYDIHGADAELAQALRAGHA